MAHTCMYVMDGYMDGWYAEFEDMIKKNWIKFNGAKIEYYIMCTHTHTTRRTR